MGPKISCESACHNLDMAEQIIHNKNYLVEDIARDCWDYLLAMFQVSEIVRHWLCERNSLD